METNRQKKVSNLLQEELAEIFRKQASDLLKGILVSVTEVRVTSDLSIAKIFISVFPTIHREKLLKEIIAMNAYYRKELGNRIGKQVRIIPHLHFMEDDSLDRVEIIEKELKGEGNNPII